MKETLDIAEYVARTALILDLEINPEYRESVIANFEKIQAIAQLVNEVPLLDKIESAPVFEP